MSEPKIQQLLLSKKYRVPQQTVFWLVILGFYTLYFGGQSGKYREILFYVSLLMPITMATTWLLNYYLMPRFLFKKRYSRFWLFLVYTIIGSVYFEMVTILLAFIFLGNYQASYLNQANFNIMYLVAANYAVVFLFTAIKLFKRWYFTQQEKQLLEQNKLQTELKLKEAELKLLRAQLNPHFLFNTLNNLYGLALEKSEFTPGAILRLSELLDYMLYKCDKPEVNLSDEWQLITHYIELEKLRHRQVSLNVHSKGPLAKVTVAPLLLLPLVENAFKHGHFNGQGQAFVNIELAVENNQITFKVVNSIDPANQSQAKTGYGIGLKNIRKRVDLLYPNSGALATTATSQHFTAQLTLSNKVHENKSTNN